MLIKISIENSRTSVKQQFADDADLSTLLECVRTEFKLQSYEIDLLVGYPPKVIRNAELSSPLSTIGISSGTSVTVRINPLKKELYNKLTEVGYPQHISYKCLELGCEDITMAVEICQQLLLNENGQLPAHHILRKVIDADNSCMFNSIGYLLQQTGVAAPVSPMVYRNLVAAAVRADPDAYLSNMVDSGKSPEEYAVWILHPNKWGGEIEMAILAGQLMVEIAAIDIQTNIAYVYGEGQGYDRRIYLLYDGIHYDALVSGHMQDGDNSSVDILPTVSDNKLASLVKVFSPTDSGAQQAMQDFARKLKEQRKFVDLAGCDLKCNICGVGLRGQSGAVEHAKLTGHQNFGQL